jgi:GNAT superfamily N-acetyltransferase
MQAIEIFLPPKGLLLLAYEDDALAGCACTRTIGEKMAELKRMYVRPIYRRKGIGTKLVQESINQMKKMKYTKMRLDSANFMTDAHRVYHSLGFKEISPYAGSEIPEEYQKYWAFMQLDLK